MTKKKTKGDQNKFEDIAKDLGCDESDDALDKAMDGLNLEVDKEEKKKKENLED